MTETQKTLEKVMEEFEEIAKKYHWNVEWEGESTYTISKVINNIEVTFTCDIIHNGSIEINEICYESDDSAKVAECDRYFRIYIYNDGKEVRANPLVYVPGYGRANPDEPKYIEFQTLEEFEKFLSNEEGIIKTIKKEIREWTIAIVSDIVDDTFKD